MENRKTILFVSYGLGIGGIEKSLVNLLNALPEERYDVDVLLMNPEYLLVPQVKKSVRFLDNFQYLLSTDFTIAEIKKRGGFHKHLDKLFPYFCHRMRILLGHPLWVKYKPIEKAYDIAVAYSQNGEPPYYVIDKVRAARKILWYHNGAYEKTGKWYALDQQYYPQFDRIVAVSQDCAKVLGKAFPEIREKLLVLHNICDVADIRRKADAFSPESYTGEQTHVVTVGRMETEKGAQLALEACRILLEEGRNICWHWVGNGNQAAPIQKQIQEFGMEGWFVLEGNQENPYPFLANADIYVQPSFYEAYSTTVTEARVLHRPIVATDVGGMRDQITSGVSGLIVPIDASAIASGIRTLLDDPGLAKSFTQVLKQEKYQAEAVLEEYEKTVFA